MAIPTNKLRFVSFSSRFNYEQVHMKGTIATTLGAVPYVIAHNLGYVPYCRVWYVYPGGLRFAASSSPNSLYDVSFTPKQYTLDIQAFAALFGTFGDPVTIHYRIYKQRAI